MSIVANNNTIRRLVDEFITNPVPIDHPEHINRWDVSQVTNMSYLFQDKDSFNDRIEAWDVSNVTTMQGMFDGASIFNQPLNSWNVSNVTDMSFMFSHAYEFNQPLDRWVVSHVTTMQGMFRLAREFNQPLNSWNVSNVTDMSHMFESTLQFNQSLDQWDVRNVRTMERMFYNSEFYEPLPWNLYNINTRNMFRGPPPFEIPSPPDTPYHNVEEPISLLPPPPPPSTELTNIPPLPFPLETTEMYDECPVCFEPLSGLNSGPGPDNYCLRNCKDVLVVCENNHMTHRGCILNVLRRVRYPSCPLCRGALIMTFSQFSNALGIPPIDLIRRAGESSVIPPLPPAAGGGKRKSRISRRSRRRKSRSRKHRKSRKRV